MGWEGLDLIPPGKFILGLVDTGLRFDLGTLSPDDVKLRVAEYAQGWTVERVDWDGGILGLVQNLRVYGHAQAAIPSLSVGTQISEAVNSFWTVAGSTTTVLVSDSLSTPPPTNQGNEQIATTIQLVALAVIAVAVVWGISQIRSITRE